MLTFSCVCLARQMLDGVLAALLNTAQVFNEEQRRADESESTRNIDGQRDIEELVNRNARSPPPPGVGSRARSGQNDGVGEASAIASAYSWGTQ